MMQDSLTAGEGAAAVADLSLYREYQAERDEILRHKWYLSEQAGHDVGFERALADWIIHHRDQWRRSRRAAQGRSSDQAQGRPG